MEAMSGPEKARCPHHTSKEAIVWGHDHDLDVLFPTDHELFLDIDTADDRATFERNRDLIDAAYGIEKVVQTYSRSGHCHLFITLREPVSVIERIALQAVLGSDRRREAHSMRRFFEGEATPTLFFERKKS
jgi:hypothetical protein